MKMSKLFNIKITIPLLLISILSIVVFFLLQKQIAHYQYMIGNSIDTRNFTGELYRFITFGCESLLFFLCLYVVTGIILLCKYGAVSLVQTLFFACISLFFVPVSNILNSEPLYVNITKGYYDRVMSSAKIDEIKDWIGRNEYSLGSEMLAVPHDEWPQAIKELLPEEVYLEDIDSKKIVVLEYGNTGSGHFGLIVMESPVSIPLDDVFGSGYRIQISPYAFVWHEHKSTDIE